MSHETYMHLNTQLRAFDLKIKVTNKTLFTKLWGIIVYNIVKSKVEILLAFFLIFILFNFGTTENEFCATQKLFKACVKQVFSMKTFNMVKDHFENLRSHIRQSLVL